MVADKDQQLDKLKMMDFLSPSAIVLDLKGSTKKAALEELISLLADAGKIKNTKGTIDVLLEREKLGSTGIGQGIAIPHAKTEHANELVAALGISRKGIQFESLDGEPVHILCVLVAPTEAVGVHLKALARISRMLKDKYFRQSLRDAKEVGVIVRLIREEDKY